MPATSQAQYRLAVEDLRRLEAGETPRTGMTQGQLQELCDCEPDALPERAERTKGKS